MINTNNDHIRNYEIGDKVRIKTPKEHSNEIGDKILIGKVTERDSDRYTIVTKYGNFERKIHKKHLYSLETDENVEVSQDKISITDAFRKFSGCLYRIEIRCVFKGGCKENKCKCRKHDKKCTMFCHSDFDHICTHNPTTGYEGNIATIKKNYLSQKNYLRALKYA
ncbi:hypothetical protein AYI68_g7357 [Smittium mucronatum]|uniref:Uncharacterized protein n=1 Tax=Smittium mucronatum TaxID=133383 RepID=A0A1R0GNY5_9FUNG|nr:hypothetical protein AYI68_g7357 [Smittium mucronatum]